MNILLEHRSQLKTKSTLLYHVYILYQVDTLERIINKTELGFASLLYNLPRAHVKSKKACMIGKCASLMVISLAVCSRHQNKLMSSAKHDIGSLKWQSCVCNWYFSSNIKFLALHFPMILPLWLYVLVLLHQSLWVSASPTTHSQCPADQLEFFLPVKHLSQTVFPLRVIILVIQTCYYIKSFILYILLKIYKANPERFQ